MRQFATNQLVGAPSGHPPSGKTTSSKFRVIELRGEDLFDSFALRYQVYCNERHFLKAADYPDRLESDEFDWQSRHVGVFDIEDRMVGTVRLVNGNASMPIDSHCDYAPPMGRLGEISRLAVSRSEAGRHFGTISLLLYRGLYQIARGEGMTHLLSAMEPSLERLVRRMHFPFEPIGPMVDYYGWVRPYALDLDALDGKLSTHAPAIYDLFNTPLDRSRIAPMPHRPVASPALVEAAVA